MVKLNKKGKSRTDFLREYDLTVSSLDKWIENHWATNSFVVKNNLSEEENELARLCKENQRLLMKNDILKQAALILGRK